MKSFRPLLATLCVIGVAPFLYSGPVYSLSNLVLAGTAGNDSLQSTGPSTSPVTLADSITLAGWGSASYSAGATNNLLSLSALATANGIVGDGLGTTGLGGVGFDERFEDSLTFASGNGSAVAVRFTLHLQADLFTSSPGDATVQVNENFYPAGNTYYFNSGLSDYDSIGDGFGPSVLNASGIYYIPDGAAVNFGIQLSGQVVAHFGFDFVHNQPFATAAGIDHTAGFLSLDILSPGGTYTSASGTRYDAPASASVPDAASVGPLLALGLGTMALAHRAQGARGAVHGGSRRG